ncbi:MAG: tRNA dihydrouridine synthase DusB [Pseudomonadota bacterium]
MSIKIGTIAPRNSVFLAPMSGVTDLPFRRLAHELGAGLVVSEMVASEELTNAREDTLLRAAGQGTIKPLVVQLAGREARWMAEGARVAEGLGADIVDINMGCPAKQVTRGLSGSALMRDLDHALTLIEATVAAVKVPVTLKMRLGWDENSINAPELARRAEQAGVQMITVHGRTRCQFYKGTANWPAISAVAEQITVPLVANGDAKNVNDAIAMRKASKADAVMVGRGAYGRPWQPGALARALGEDGGGVPDLKERGELICRHYEDMLSHYGREMGVRCARKHLGWYLETAAEDGLISTTDAALWRAELCREDDPKSVLHSLHRLFSGPDLQEAA